MHLDIIKHSNFCTVYQVVVVGFFFLFMEKCLDGLFAGKLYIELMEICYLSCVRHING